MKTTHAIVLIFESFEIQTLAGNTAMLFLRKVQKSRKAFLKRLSKTCKSRRKGTPFILTFKKSVSHFLKKVISRWRKGFLKKKVFLLFWILACKRKEKKCFSSNPLHSYNRNSYFDFVMSSRYISYKVAVLTWWWKRKVWRWF